MLEGIERARAQGHRLALAELLRVRGMVLIKKRRWDEAERAFEEAVSVSRSMRYPYAEGRALYEWGLVYAGRPDSGRARELLERAAEIFRGLGSRPYSDLAQRALAGLNLLRRRVPGSSQGVCPLSGLLTEVRTATATHSGLGSIALRYNGSDLRSARQRRHRYRW